MRPFSNSLSLFEQFHFSSLFRAACSLLSNSKILQSLSSSSRLVLKFSGLFRAVVCSLFSNSLLSFERFAPCSQSPQSLSSNLRLVLKFCSLFRGVVCSLFLKFSTLFRAICALFSNSLVPERAVCSLFSNSLVSLERFAPCPNILYSLASCLLPARKFPCPFRTVCALFSNSLISFERFCSLFSKFSNLFRAVCVVFSSSLLSFGGFAPCSQIPYSLPKSLRLVFENLESLSIGLLLILQFSTLFRAVLLLALKLPSPFRAVCDVLKFSSLFRAV